MNTKNSLIFLISLFPIFAIKSNILLIEYIIIFTLYLLVVSFFFIKKFSNLKLEKIILSSIIVYGIDNHLGLFNGFIQPNIIFILNFFKIVYVPSFLILIILLF